MNKIEFLFWGLRALVVAGMLALALPVSGQARVVRVGPGDATGQGHGHGFVFGSAKDGSCWLATPAHVLRTSQGDLRGDVLRDARGRSGVAVDPIQPDAKVDLAFARVSGLGGQCLDRLPTRKLASLLEAGGQARLNLIDSADGGARAMPLRIRAVDGGNKAIKFSVEPVPSAADQHPRIIQGYSGGLIDRQDATVLGHDSLPLGLVLSVCTGGAVQIAELEALLNDNDTTVVICAGGHYATALSFDEVRRLFSQIETKSDEKTKPRTTKVQPQLLNFGGQTITGNPASLLGGEQCWTVQPDANGRVPLDYLMPKNVKSTAIIIEPCDSDGNLGGVQVLGGTTIDATTAYRYCSAQSEKLYCTIGTRKATVLRLDIIPKVKNTPLKLRLIRVETAPI
jgi:hypothetical protein